LVPQDDGPEHLAAADLLVSPHVTNPDGTPFFGSPTKLFEYMAMGRPIVASDLEQIGQTLEHGRTAWLVPPGDVEALADAMARRAAAGRIGPTAATRRRSGTCGGLASPRAKSRCRCAPRFGSSHRSDAGPTASAFGLHRPRAPPSAKRPPSRRSGS